MIQAHDNSSTLIKEIIAFSLLALLFLALALQQILFEFLIGFNEEQWYKGTATITQSYVVDKVKKGQGPLANRTTHSYQVYANYQYRSQGTTYESNRISNFGRYIIAKNRSEAYQAIQTFLKPGKSIKVNISKKPPVRSYLFREKLPNSDFRLEIGLFLIAVLAAFAVIKTTKQLKQLKRKEKHAKPVHKQISI